MYNAMSVCARVKCVFGSAVLRVASIGLATFAGWQPAGATVQGAVGVVTSYRIYTVKNATSATHDASAFQISPAMGGVCSWVWVDASDKNTLAVVLAAKTTGASVTINFEDTVFSPWGDTSMCALTLISLN